MKLENKIKCVLMDFEINQITLQEATKRILLLLDVVGQSKQLVCPDCKDGRDSFDPNWLCPKCRQKEKVTESDYHVNSKYPYYSSPEQDIILEWLKETNLSGWYI